MEKKTKKKNKKKNNNNNIIKIIIPIVLVIILVILIVFFINKGETLTCSKVTDSNNVYKNQKVVFSIKKDEIKEINALIKIELKNNTNVDYKDAVKKALEDNYKKEKVKYEIAIKDDYIEVSLKYDAKKEYIIDNLLLSLTEDGMELNVLKEDLYNEYAKFNLENVYDIYGIKEIMKDSGYKCN